MTNFADPNAYFKELQRVTHMRGTPDRRTDLCKECGQWDGHRIGCSVIASAHTIAPIGTVRKRHNAVGVKVAGGWTVVWTLFNDGTAHRGFFYSDGSAGASYIAEGELVAGPSWSEVAFSSQLTVELRPD